MKQASTSTKRKFYDRLRNLQGDDKVAWLRRYSGSLDPFEDTTDFKFYRNIDPRVDTSKYFYFPTEAPIIDTNCFERNAAVHFAVQEVYPEANPSLVLINWDRSVHASVLFTHNGRLHCADPVNKLMGPIILRPDRMIFLPDGEKGERVVEFDAIKEVEQHTLDDVIHHLRREDGVVNFLYESGQRTSTALDWPDNFETFMRVDESGSIIAEVRIYESMSQSRAGCIRWTYDPDTKKLDSKVIEAERFFWSDVYGEKQLAGETVLLEDKISSTNFSTNHLQNFHTFLLARQRGWTAPHSYHEYVNHPVVQARIGEAVDKEAEAEASYEAMALAVEFLQFRYGPISELAKMPAPDLSVLEETAIIDGAKVVEFIHCEANWLIYTRYAVSVAKLSLDAMKYIKEVARQLDPNQLPDSSLILPFSAQKHPLLL